MVIRIPPVGPAIPAELIAELGRTPPATIGHKREHELVDVGLRPTSHRFSFRGSAVTVRGFGIGGVLTDRVEIEDLGFPIFGRGLSPVTTRGGGTTGELNVPVRCGGVMVNPGDIILADDDGILVLAPERVASIVETFLPRVLREPEMHRQMREGGVSLSERSGAKKRIEDTLRRQAEQG
ncbi:MAG TPA: hypothetical protein VKU87_06245 [Thermomicrobiaceae bacterium]|nr:hypothetical protein [Thermomicrobiaceae bacterium]